MRNQEVTPAKRPSGKDKWMVERRWAEADATASTWHEYHNLHYTLSNSLSFILRIRIHLDRYISFHLYAYARYIHERLRVRRIYNSMCCQLASACARKYILGQHDYEIHTICKSKQQASIYTSQHVHRLSYRPINIYKYIKDWLFIIGWWREPGND